MNEQMTFPNTWKEFESFYGFDDKEQIYTNGSRLILSFRVEQWLNHLPQWIPCSERLPEKQTTILVTDFGDVQMAYINDEGRWMDFHGDKLKDVTAWMPLPEPYKGDEE